MNIGQLITCARSDYLADATAVDKLWDDAFMIRAFTEAQRQACNRSDFLYEELTITLAEDVATYLLNTRITKLDQVLFEDNVLAKVSIADLDYNTASWRSSTVMTGKSCRYAIRGNRIRFIPSPATDDDGLTVTLECYVLPEDAFTGTSDEPVIPEEFHRDLVYWVLYEALSKRDADTFDIKANEYLARFEAVFGRYVSAQVRQHQLENGLSMALMPTDYNNTAVRVLTTDDW